MKSSKYNPFGYKDTEENHNEELKRDTIEYFQRNHFISAIVRQGIQAFAMCDVEMQLCTDIFSRIETSLRRWGHSDDENPRPLQQLTHVVRQFVIRMAEHYTWDFPGAPFYGKPFELNQLRELQRYLYVTPDIILYVLTLMTDQLIDLDAGIVFRAMFRMLNIEDHHASPYELMKKHPNLKFKETKINGDVRIHKVNLNYLQFDYSVDRLAQKLVNHTSPKLEAEHIKAILLRLNRKTCVPRCGPRKRNGYAEVDWEVLQKHKSRVHIRAKLDRNNFIFNISQYVNDSVERYVKAVARQTNCQPNQLRTKLQNEDILFMHSMIGQDDNEWTVETVKVRCEELTKRGLNTIDEEDYNRVKASIANWDASMTLSFRHAMLILKGLNDEYFYEPGGSERTVWPTSFDVSEDEIPMIYNVPVSERSKVEYQNLSVVEIETNPNRVYICPMAYDVFLPEILLDAWEEAVLSPSMKPQKFLLGWQHKDEPTVQQVHRVTRREINQFTEIYDRIAREMGAIPRSSGLGFVRKTHAKRSMELFISEGQRPSKKRKPDPVVVIENLSYESALRQHVRCCMPVEEPVRCPKYIRKMYEDAGGEVGRHSYPDVILDALARSKAEWEATQLDNARDIMRDIRNRNKNQ